MRQDLGQRSHACPVGSTMSLDMIVRCFKEIRLYGEKLMEQQLQRTQEQLRKGCYHYGDEMCMKIAK